MLATSIIIVSAYLWGAIPTSFLVAHWLRNIDLRNYGSGNVGASNVMRHVSLQVGLCVGVVDCVVKGTAPILLTRLLGYGVDVQVVVGLSTVAGHNWSPYLRFTGGRGVATGIGVLMGFVMWKEMLILSLTMGLSSKLVVNDSGLWTFISLLALPVLVWFFHGNSELLYMSIILGVLILMKRLTSNWESTPLRGNMLGVLATRIICDRDILSRDKWIGRNPGVNSGASRD